MKISVLLIYLSYFCCLFLGNNILIALGYKDSFWGKYLPHPAIYLLSLAFVFSSWRKILRYKEELKLFIFLFIAVIVTMLLNGAKFPYGSFYPSIMLPALLSVTLSECKGMISKKFLQNIFYLYFIIECSLAIVEKLQGNVFFPELGFETNFNTGNDSFRAFSLRGHPLSNASFVSLMICFIIVSCKSRIIKNGLILLGFISLLCFNSRFSLVITTLVYVIFVIRDFKKSSTNYRIFYIIIITLSIYYAFSLFVKGWGDRLIEQGLNDDSAAARLVALQIVTDNSIFDFFKGYDAATIENITNSMEGIGATIENCWIIFLLQYGIVFLCLGIYYYIPVFRKQCKDYSRVDAYIIIIPWLLIVSSSNSIASGGLTICSLFLLMFAFSQNNTYNKLR